MCWPKNIPFFTGGRIFVGKSFKYSKYLKILQNAKYLPWLKYKYNGALKWNNSNEKTETLNWNW